MSTRLQLPNPLREGRPIHQVLACVDRSSFSAATVRHAVEVSKSLESALTLLYVMEPPRERLGQHAADVLDWEIARQEATAYLERLQEEAARALGRRVGVRLEQGHPAERITSVAREIGADLTVLGSRGERGAAGWNLGSTAQQVLAVLRGSVLVARSGWGDVARDESPIRILVPLDGSRRTESVLPTVVRLARAHDANLLLVYVVPEPIATAVLRAPPDLEVARDLSARLEASGRRYLDDLRAHLAHQGVSPRTLVLRNPDGKQSLLELSEKERSDLIVLCAHGSTCNPTFPFGGVTSHLLAHSTISVLVLQDLGETELGGEEGNGRAPLLRASPPGGV
jgi:nucleotide-binding universal stress UspA family protein